MIFGDHVGLKLPDICMTGEEKRRIISPRKLVPTGDRTRARCVTGVRATAFFPTVGGKKSNKKKSECPFGGQIEETREYRRKTKHGESGLKTKQMRREKREKIT